MTITAVRELVAEALCEGAEAMVGGVDRAGTGFFFYPATVLAGVSAPASLLQTELFGPVAPIVFFTEEDEAVAPANDSQYGLAPYACTGELGRGFRVAEAVETRVVGLNNGLVSDPVVPFGGVEQGGLGREGGHDGLLAYTEQKYIACSW